MVLWFGQLTETRERFTRLPKPMYVCSALC